jgi:hypothetical protein
MMLDHNPKPVIETAGHPAGDVPFLSADPAIHLEVGPVLAGPYRHQRMRARSRRM